MTKRWISSGEWFDAGTVVELLEDWRPEMDAGLFFGLRNGLPDEEVCGWDEFPECDHPSEKVIHKVLEEGNTGRWCGLCGKEID